MQCWVCKRVARGFGCRDGRYPAGDPRRYPLDWVFCSSRCQQAFSTLYGNWTAGYQGGAMTTEADMEQQARQTCLRALGAAISQIGFDKPPATYTEAEALALIDAIVSQYCDAMVAQHEAMRYPPVRGLRAPVTDPLADFQDDIPW